MSAKLMVLFAVICIAHCRVPSNPLRRMFAGVEKRASSCAHECVPICYDDGYGSYNHRSGSCSKSGHSCCEWVVHGKREMEVKKEEKRAQSCAYDCVPICYDDGYGSYNHRSGSCSKSGHSCCEWVVHGKREMEVKQEEKRAQSCAYDCVPICYDDGYGSYNHRSGSCSKSGHSCCEWVVHGKREMEVKQEEKRAQSCAYDCVPICYDDGYGSYNHRSGSCSKSGHSCCEWVVHGKREMEVKQEEKRAQSCAYDCVPICYDDGYGSYNHRSGSCSKSGHSCCEWEVHGKRDATLE